MNTIPIAFGIAAVLWGLLLVVLLWVLDQSLDAPPRPKPYNPDAVDALSAAIQDADIEAGNYEDGLPSLAAWERVVECWQEVER